MAYSITTKDGITIDNIPDGIAPDAPELKQRVADLRASGGQPPAPKAAESIAAAPNPETKAPTSGYAMGLRDPVDAGAQLLRRAVPDAVANAVDNFGNWLSEKGLPVAKSNGVEGVDRIVTDVNKQYDARRKAEAPAGEEPGFDVGRLAGNIVNPVNFVPGSAVAKGANTVKSLALRGAAAGAVGGALQPVIDPGDNFGGKKALQMATGAATGGILTPVLAKTGEKLVRGVQNVRAAMQPAPDINVATNNVFGSQGINPAEVSDSIKQSVSRQIAEAFQTKTKIDPAALIRKAEFEAVGLADDAGPTLGQMTRNPMQFAKEKNLSGINIDGGNDLSARFQAQNNRLADVFDKAGAAGAIDRNAAGQTLIDALKKADAPVKQGVDDLYGAARDMSAGRVADLDRAAFSQAANTALDDGMFNAFVPANVRTLLNDVTAGKGPFNVESAVQIDTLLSKAQRQAERGGDDAGSLAIGKIRSALHDTPMMARAAGGAANAADDSAAAAAATAARTVDDGITDVPFRETSGRIGIPAPQSASVAARAEPQYARINTEVGPAITPSAAPIDEGLAAREAFDQARRAARSRFATIEETPALKAALDEAAPDKFVQKYIMGADVRDVQAMKKVLSNSPEAQAQARAQVADYLKRAAFGENPSGDKAFSADRYLKTLDSMGKQKLELFFTQDEVVKLKLAGKVASDINSIPAGAKYGTNTSGTAAAAINAITGILSKVPGGGVLGVPLNFVKNEVGKYSTQKAIQDALRAAPQQLTEELPADIAKLLQVIGTTGGAAGGAATAPTFKE